MSYIGQPFYQPIAPATYGVRQDGTEITVPQSAALLAAWTASAQTVFEAVFPATGASPLRFPGGTYNFAGTYTQIETPGTGASVVGDGYVSQLWHVGFKINQYRCTISDVAIINPESSIPDGSIGIEFSNGPANAVRYFSFLTNVWIRGWDVGILFGVDGLLPAPAVGSVGFGAFDNGTDITIEGCNTGIKIVGTSGLGYTNVEVNSCSGPGIEMLSGGETKLTDVRCLACAPNWWSHGSSMHPIFENYLSMATFTVAQNRYIPIYAATDNGDNRTRLQVADKLDATITFYGAAMARGKSTRPAEAIVLFLALIRTSPVTGGQVDSITVTENGTPVSLIASAVLFTTTLAQLCADVVTAINARSGITGYRAMQAQNNTASTILYIYTVSDDGTTANGYPVAVAYSGGGNLEVSVDKYVQVVTTTPHGLTNDGMILGTDDDIEYQASSGATEYDGIMAVAAVLDTTTLLAYYNLDEGSSAGQMWTPYRLAPHTLSVKIVDQDGETVVPANMSISEVGQDYVLVDIPFGSFPVLAATDRISVPGWDMILEAEDTNINQHADLFVNGGNINYLLVKSAYNIQFWGTRLKCLIWIDQRSLDVMHSNLILFMRGGRGRQAGNATWNTVPICGTNKGWKDISVQSDSDSLYAAAAIEVSSPNSAEPMVGYIATQNTVRVAETNIQNIVGDIVAQQWGALGPELTWDFTTDGVLPNGATLTRASTGWYFDSSGVLQSAAIDTPRWTYNPSSLVLQGLLVEPAATNVLRNSSGTNAVAGTPGTVPDFWDISGAINNVTRSIVASGTSNGVPYASVRFAGTPSASSSAVIAFEQTTQIAASQGELYTTEAYVRLATGSSMTNATLNLAINEYDGGGGFLPGGTATTITPTTAALTSQRTVNTHEVLDASAAFVRPRLSLGYTSGNAIDVTLEIFGNIVLSDEASSPIPTTTVAVTRSADALSIAMDDGMYHIDIERLSGTTSLPGVVVTGGSYPVPTDVSPLRGITAWRVG